MNSKIESRYLSDEKSRPMSGRKVFGKLVIADGKAVFEKLNDAEFLKDCMLKAADKGKLNVLATNIHRFEPQGITGILVLQESHFSIHTWPEHGYIAIDIFACGNEGDPVVAVKEFSRLIGMTDGEVKIYDRGLL